MNPFYTACVVFLCLFVLGMVIVALKLASIILAVAKEGPFDEGEEILPDDSNSDGEGV